MFLWPANDDRLSPRANAIIARAAVDRWKATQIAVTNGHCEGKP
jgi:hypothetical protein